ncbi:hypothetical protein BGZ88_003771 [Linnemannia elongata]|nr:hypothetical protein BGZ88_003771 [Linnemannia elongata]
MATVSVMVVLDEGGVNADEFLGFKSLQGVGDRLESSSGGGISSGECMDINGSTGKMSLAKSA